MRMQKPFGSIVSGDKYMNLVLVISAGVIAAEHADCESAP